MFLYFIFSTILLKIGSVGDNKDSHKIIFISASENTNRTMPYTTEKLNAINVKTAFSIGFNKRKFRHSSMFKESQTVMLHM